tara:strand:- start:3016 stop:3930 length:915 start_codon:yes stop_codon:yes gene_type:complete
MGCHAMSSDRVKRVGVVGAGTMGAGIAQICAESGFDTMLFDEYPESLEKGRKQIYKFWDRGIQKGRISRSQKALWSSKISFVDDLESAVNEADLVVEAVPEDLKLKKEIFLAIEGFCKPNSILASNTSSLSIGRIAKDLNRPQNTIGMHFFNPVPIMELLEIVRHERTSADVVTEVEKIGRLLGKTTIIVNDVPGFATSRLGVVLGNEAIRMLAEGVATASDIDTAMRLGYRHPMGPLELSDLVGLDVRRDILKGLAESFNDDSYLPHPLLDRLVSEGTLGKKTGIGIYSWENGVKRERDDLAR